MNKNGLCRIKVWVPLSAIDTPEHWLIRHTAKTKRLVRKRKYWAYPALALLEDMCVYLKGTAVSFAHGLLIAVGLKHARFREGGQQGDVVVEEMEKRKASCFNPEESIALAKSSGFESN